MSFGILRTDGGTHDPEGWAHFALQEFIPTPPGADPHMVDRVIMARQSLRPAVASALTEIREHERRSLDTLNPLEAATLKEVVHRHHGRPTSAGEELDQMHLWTRGKVRGSDDWLEKYVRRIVAAVGVLSDGEKVGHNEMTHNIYNILGMYVRSLQHVERSHFVTERHPIEAR